MLTQRRGVPGALNRYACVTLGTGALTHWRTGALHYALSLFCVKLACYLKHHLNERNSMEEDRYMCPDAGPR